MKNFLPAIIILLSSVMPGLANEPSPPDNSKAAAQPAPEDRPDKAESDKSFLVHKVNYFALNHWPGNEQAQVKFQFSLKFPVLQPDLYVFKNNIFPAYFAYTQKSLWNVGQNSMPFEESNYNPEFFLDYPVRVPIYGQWQLSHLVFSPFEHESNGLSGIRSRSWNRQYALARLNFEPDKQFTDTNAFILSKASFYIKLWHATGYSDQTNYLRSIGSRDNFLDYMGRGEIGLSVRNTFWGGKLIDHQLDLKAPLFQSGGKKSYQAEFRQKLPNTNFAIYFQYWRGYGETLLRFDQSESRGFIGLSFSY